MVKRYSSSLQKDDQQLKFACNYSSRKQKTFLRESETRRKGSNKDEGRGWGVLEHSPYNRGMISLYFFIYTRVLGYEESKRALNMVPIIFQGLEYVLNFGGFYPSGLMKF